MIPAHLVATLASAFLLSLGPTQADTLDGIRRVNRLLRDHYGTRIRVSPAAGSRWTSAATECNGGKGDLCNGGDPDRGYCGLNSFCHPTEEWLVRGLVEEARNHPTSGFLTGQAVYALTKFGFVGEAGVVVEGCQAQAWWCEALRGYLLYTQGEMERAEASFREAFSGAPADLRCSWGDALWLLGEWDQRTAGLEALPEGRTASAEWSCQERLAASDTLFWWGDPLLSDEGNDRWTEHVARAMAGHFYAEIQRVSWGAEVPQRYQDHDWAMRIRRGPWDSYRGSPGFPVRVWTSSEAAAYRFLPAVEPGAFDRPVWRLEGDYRYEGYTPDYGPLHVVPAQLARFRAGDSLRLAAAGGLVGTPLRRATSATVHLVLSDAPGSRPVRLTREVRREAAAFLAEAEPRDYLVGFEAFTRIGIGWHRELVSPLARGGPEISDLLLFEASEVEEPASLSEAVTAMLGSTTLADPGRLGVYWEAYGAPAQSTLSFEVTLERETGGLVDRLAALLPGGEQEGRGRVTWTEPAAGEVHPRAVTLDLGGLGAGEYSLILRVVWEGQEPLERRRRLVVGESG